MGRSLACLSTCGIQCVLLCCAGYFTSRPASKAYIRSATAYLQAARQLEAFMGLPAGDGSSDGMCQRTDTAWQQM